VSRDLGYIDAHRGSAVTSTPNAGCVAASIGRDRRTRCRQCAFATPLIYVFFEIAELRDTIFVGLDEMGESAYHAFTRHVDRDLESIIRPARCRVYGPGVVRLRSSL
jgi:hypothetical protein